MTAGLLWLDLETTGLDPKNDRILEVGWGITDMNMDWVVEPRGHLIDTPLATITDLWGKDQLVLGESGWAIDQFVVDMHQESGLWADLKEGPRQSLASVEELIIDWIGFVPLEPAVLAGSGVAGFDLQWLKIFMPKLAMKLTYYTIDTGIVERFLSLSRTGEIRSSNKSAAHRAVDDIEWARAKALELRSSVI